VYNCRSLRFVVIENIAHADHIEHLYAIVTLQTSLGIEYPTHSTGYQPYALRVQGPEAI
jgi:hypothetical protein